MQLPTKLTAGLLLLCSPALANANAEQPQDVSLDLSWREKIVFGVGHQNPEKAPAIPIVNKESVLNDTTAAYSYSNSSLNALYRRDGALHCDSAPCPDGSCCGSNGICGYGPEFCGDGCTSQCDATAMCGEFSEDAEMPCGMNLCCSSSGWCGTTEVFCHNADPLHQTLPCQAGYGSCSIASPPSCSADSGSSSGRTVGYYQSWNVRNRKCDTKTPSQLNTKGFTHLFYSFAFIDPNSFSVVPAHDDDIEQMREFTDLSSDGKLQTWIAIGGFDFSNEDTPTHTTWSDMVSTKANRAKFITSLEAYMKEYGFQGVDLDWEYPGDPKRGGRKLADTRNLSLLVREMRAAYGSRFGISVTLAPDYWYLRWFDAKAMEPNVDFFGFMAYDLHGSWDSDVRTLGKIVRGQADIREINNNTAPLWFDGLDPKKINFGLAMYGRGYTLADSRCNSLGCSFAGPSNPGECTAQAGVLSLSEINKIAKEKDIHPTYLAGSMMKELTWDDQWIGYDDEETFAAKKEFANSLCFGGTMVWSIDFQDNTPDFGVPGDASVDIPNKGIGTNRNLLPFKGFVNCKPEQADMIEAAWQDVQVLVEESSKFNLDTSWWNILCGGKCRAGPIEKFIWGDDIKSRTNDIQFIRKIYNNVKALGSSVHIDNKIRIGCNVDYTKEAKSEKASCKTNSGKGGFAFSTGGKTDFKDGTIVVCNIFYNRPTIAEIKQDLKDNPNYQALPAKRLGQGTLLLHEITHLDSISGGGDDHIYDQDYRTVVNGKVKFVDAYGVDGVAALAKNKPTLTAWNADSYAIYASIQHFNKDFGTIKHNELRDDGDDDEDSTGPTKALNILRDWTVSIGSSAGQSSSQLKWQFYSVPYGTGSLCQKQTPALTFDSNDHGAPVVPMAAPGGTYAVTTPDGDCEYKNDGTGNAGALWCSGKGHSCRMQEGRTEWTLCDGGSFGGVKQMPVVVCEW